MAHFADIDADKKVILTWILFGNRDFKSPTTQRYGWCPNSRATVLVLKKCYTQPAGPCMCAVPVAQRSAGEG
jgi:hypothetical protein